MLPTGAFARRLAVVAGLALAVRIVAAIVSNDNGVQGDALTFHTIAQHLADGEGFRRPFEDEPTAEHPPAWTVVLALADLLGATGHLAHRLLGGLIGTATVVGIGLLGRRIAGERAGLVAALIAAVHPMLWGADVSLMSEPLYGLVLVAALLAATRLRDRPTLGRAAAVGAVLGLAALVRGEALLLLPLLVVPLALVVARPWGRRVRLVVAAGVAFALVIAPWTARNLATFDSPVLISTNANAIWIGANCEPTYFGDQIGYWAFGCYTARRPGEDEAEWAAREQREGLAYLREHAGRLPAVIPHRVARTLDVAHVEQSVFINTQEGRGGRPTRWGIRLTWVLLALAPIGAFVLRRRGRPLVELLAPIALILLVSVVFYGVTRFRFAAEPSLCILAAAALTALPSLRRA